MRFTSTRKITVRKGFASALALEETQRFVSVEHYQRRDNQRRRKLPHPVWRRTFMADDQARKVIAATFQPADRYLCVVPGSGIDDLHVLQKSRPFSFRVDGNRGILPVQK